tara:strand:+ start:1955 stop:2167 length:213 start_codon:yes stop_codon:yes gene_type:complete
MRRISNPEIKKEDFKAADVYKDTLISTERLDLNVLLKRRKEEKKMDKKTNILIFSGATAVAGVVLAILSL